MVSPETGNMVFDPILSKRAPPRICRLFSPLASERGSFDGKSKDIMGYPHLCGVHWRVFRLPLSRDEMVCDPIPSGRFSLPLGSSHRVPLGITRHPRQDTKDLRGASRIEDRKLASCPRIKRLAWRVGDLAQPPHRCRITWHGGRGPRPSPAAGTEVLTKT